MEQKLQQIMIVLMFIIFCYNAYIAIKSNAIFTIYDYSLGSRWIQNTFLVLMYILSLTYIIVSSVSYDVFAYALASLLVIVLTISMFYNLVSRIK